MKGSIIVLFGCTVVLGLLCLDAFSGDDIGVVVNDEFLLAFGLLIGSYCGTSQLAGVLKTKALPAGERFTGNRGKLFLVTLYTLVLAIACLKLELIVRRGLPVRELFTMFFVVSSLFVGGEKIKTSVEGGK